MATKADNSNDDDLRKQIETLRADLEKLTAKLLETGSEQASKLVDDARRTGGKVLDEARAKVDEGRAYGEQQVENAEAWIRRNPILAVACALGAGFVAAHLRGRR